MKLTSKRVNDTQLTGYVSKPPVKSNDRSGRDFHLGESAKRGIDRPMQTLYLAQFTFRSVEAFSLASGFPSGIFDGEGKVSTSCGALHTGPALPVYDCPFLVSIVSILPHPMTHNSLARIYMECLQVRLPLSPFAMLRTLKHNIDHQTGLLTPGVDDLKTSSSGNWKYIKKPGTYLQLYLQ